ncbi:MAG: sugar nucleotide-binding protein [Thermoguttaceae bacterium]|jgi:dTDP-4-dehydrorhamnose reductase
MSTFRLSQSADLPLPLLITGIAGVAGYHALSYFQGKYPGRVFGIRQVENSRLAGPGIIACNAEDRQAMARLFDRHRFASVLDCAGNCALKACELDRELAWRINVEGVRNLLSQTVARGARLVHLSVDLVFSGERDGGYCEDDPPDPVTIYGKTMAVGEQLCRQCDPTACTLRISLPMGISFSGHAGAIDWITSRFKKSRPATLYFDEVRTPTYTDCLNPLYETVLRSDLSGLFHAGAPRRLSLYQIAQILNRVGGYDPDCLHGIPRREASPIPPRAGNVSMDSSRLTAALGYNPFHPWPWDDCLVPTHGNWHRERPAAEAGSPERLHELLAVNPARAGCGEQRRPCQKMAKPIPLSRPSLATGWESGKG